MTVENLKRNRQWSLELSVPSFSMQCTVTLLGRYCKVLRFEPTFTYLNQVDGREPPKIFVC